MQKVHPTGRRQRLLAIVRTCVPAWLVALPGAAFVLDAASRASWSTLGRDQGIFQYVAWAIQKGDVAYRDVRDVNGPVIPLLHGAFQRLGGADEHRFRVLDLVCACASYAFAGAALPSVFARAGRGEPSWATRGSWAAAAIVALLAQYLAYGFWDTAQRESFLDWFAIVSVAALGAVRTESAPRVRIALLGLAGFTSFLPWLGKPTYAAFTAVQLVVIAIDDGGRGERARRLALFAAGGIAGLTLPLVWLARHGDVGAWAQITFVDIPAMYRFIWPRTARGILELPGYQTNAIYALATTLGLLALVMAGRLPRRAIPIALFPTVGLVSVLVQAKGFPYHFHPVTLGIGHGWLLAIAATWDLVEREGDQPRIPAYFRRAAVLALAGLAGGRAAALGMRSPWPAAPEARDPAALEARLDLFERVDFFPRALRGAAEHIARSTGPEDRVQMYGMDAYLLFLAHRRSATPYIYAYDLNVDAALYGSFEEDGLHPTAEQRAGIQALRDAHARDLLERLDRAPPAAFVFVDRSPLMSYPDAAVDFAAHCPEASAWVAARYHETYERDGVRVWMPLGDEAPPAALPPDRHNEGAEVE